MSNFYLTRGEDLLMIYSPAWALFAKNYQGGHGTGKTGNLDVNFSRRGKHREFS